MRKGGVEPKILASIVAAVVIAAALLKLWTGALPV